MNTLLALLLTCSVALAAGVPKRSLQQSAGAYGDADVCSGASGNAATFNFALGDFDAKLLQDSQFQVAEEGVSAFVLQDPAIVRRALEARYADIVSDPLFFINILYLDTGDDRILFDVGYGAALSVAEDSTQSGALLQELAANNIDPASITKILLTHGHIDHIAGLFKDANATDPSFPNADIFVSRIEWDYWLGDNLNTFESKLPQEFLDQLETGAKLYFGQIEDRVTLFEVDTEVIPGIECIHTPWHTPGHCAYLVKSGNDSVLVTGDSIIDAVLGVENPWFNVIPDLRIDMGPAGRYELLDRAVAGRWLLNVMHGAFPALGYASEDGGTRFRWHERSQRATPGAVAVCPA